MLRPARAVMTHLLSQWLQCQANGSNAKAMAPTCAECSGRRGRVLLFLLLLLLRDQRDGVLLPQERQHLGFEGLILSHHSRFNVTYGCNKEEIDDE